jgi:hypothetical protein
MCGSLSSSAAPPWFGFPNDEALGGHALFSPDDGLSFYATHEVLESTWLEEVRAIERAHPQSAATPFPNTRHWVLTFHDSTLDALALGIDLHGDHPNRASATTAMVDLLALG